MARVQEGVQEMSKAHCWASGPETDDGCSTTCILKSNHGGPHEWTRDDQIRITFR